MNGPDTRECGHLAGEISVDLCEQFWAKNRFRYGNPAAEYELLGSDEAGEFGQTTAAGEFYPLPEDDPYVTILRRQSDGQAFEIEIEVTARPLDPAPTARGPIPGQMELPA